MDEIGDYMSSPALSIDYESSVQEAGQYMRVNGVGSLLVKEFGDFVGMITETDLTRRVIARGLNPETTKVTDVMTTPILSMDRYLPVDQANEFMCKHKIRHLAVTEEDEIVGIISVKNLVSYYAKSFRMVE